MEKDREPIDILKIRLLDIMAYFYEKNTQQMDIYISLLRGINVSGHKIIKMELLRKMYENLGFKEVKSYIQSGNLVFRYESGNISEIEELIKNKILKEFGFEVQIQILKPEILKYAIHNHPFMKDENLDAKQHYFVFLNENPSPENWEILKNMNFNGELMELGNKIIFIHYPNGAGQSKLTTNLIESKLKVSATARNLNTTKKLLEMAF